MKRKNAYTIFYAILLGLACAAIPTGWSIVTKPMYDANKKLDEDKNVLEVLGVSYDTKLPAKDVVAFFDQNIEKQIIGQGADQLIVYYAKSNAQAIAVNFQGRGLWGPIRGYLSLAPDLKTINGFTIYYHEETPGLGGEIEKPWFKDQFKGKKIEDANGKPGFYVRRAGATITAPDEIDGISGATLTGNKLTVILNDLIAKIEKINKGDLHVGQ